MTGPPQPPLPPPGWFHDPAQYGVLRWWDGTRWTEHATYAQPPLMPPPSSWSTPEHRDRAQEALLPVNRTGLSIAAGYVGLLSILIVPSPVAVALGIMALLDLRKHPGMAGHGRAWFAIIAGSLGTVGLIAILSS